MKYSPAGYSVPKIAGIMVLFALALAALSLPIRYIVQKTEPLAERTSLEKLIAGETIPEPDDQSTAFFHQTHVVPPALASLNTTSRVLGLNTLPFANDSKRIEVDLTNQKVYAFEGDNKIFEFIVSTGKWGRTPTGEFVIWAKVKSQTMKGGSVALRTYYNLPNVPWVMFFYNKEIAKMRGFSFHGTYWHNNFGRPMSHGCINMKSDEAKILYEWANPVVMNAKAWSTNASADNPGTKVVIYGVAPKS